MTVSSVVQKFPIPSRQPLLQYLLLAADELTSGIVIAGRATKQFWLTCIWSIGIVEPSCVARSRTFSISLSSRIWEASLATQQLGPTDQRSISRLNTVLVLAWFDPTNRFPWLIVKPSGTALCFRSSVSRSILTIETSRSRVRFNWLTTQNSTRKFSGWSDMQKEGPEQ